LHRGQDSSGRDAALRLLAPELLAGPGVLQALVADLKAASGVVHPGVARVLGLVDIAGRRAVVYEWVAGRSLAEPLRQGQRLPFAQTLALAQLLYQALAAIHAKGLVHGTLQPSNVLLVGGSVKLADFGMGRLRQQFPGVYRAPEARFDAEGDLYAAAAVVYHTLTGVNPVSLPQGAALPLASTRAAGVPEAFDSLLLRALHPQREHRPPAATACLGALRAIGESR
jgi:serine/threonine protein kinase